MVHLPRLPACDHPRRDHVVIDPGLQGKVLLVTGDNSPYGIGAAAATAFAAAGARALSTAFVVAFPNYHSSYIIIYDESLALCRLQPG